MIIATVNDQCTVQTLRSDSRYPGYYSKTHLAQSWQDNLFLWVQSRLECWRYDLLKERKKKVQLSKGSISCFPRRQKSSGLQKEWCLRGSTGPSPRGVSFPRSCCHLHLVDWQMQILQTQVSTDEKKKCERAWRFACRKTPNSRKSIYYQELHKLFQQSQESHCLWWH